MSRLVITLPTWPPSSNTMYLSQGRFRRLSPKAREWIDSTKELLKDLKQPPEFIGQQLKITIVLYGPWICLNGKIRKADVASREKCLTDTIFKMWPDLDDCQAWDLRLIKRVAAEEKIEVTIDVLYPTASENI